MVECGAPFTSRACVYKQEKNVSGSFILLCKYLVQIYLPYLPQLSLALPNSF